MPAEACADTLHMYTQRQCDMYCRLDVVGLDVVAADC